MLSIESYYAAEQTMPAKRYVKSQGKWQPKHVKVIAFVDRLSKKLIPETNNDRKLPCNFLDTAKNVRKVIEQSEAVNAGNTKILLTDLLVWWS